LTDYQRTGSFNGFPAMGIQWQRMESAALRRAYKMDAKQKGGAGGGGVGGRWGVWEQECGRLEPGEGAGAGDGCPRGGGGGRGEPMNP